MSRFILAQLTDPQIGFENYNEELLRFRREIDMVNESDCECAVICGDMMHRGDAESFSFFTREISRLKKPVFFIAGNHDANSAGQAALYESVFGKTYYAADMPCPDYRLISLDSNLWTKDREKEALQMENMVMLELAKAAEKHQKIIVSAHSPLFVNSVDEEPEYFNLPREKRDWLLNLFQKYSVSAFLSGHTHKAFTCVWHGILFSSGETTSIAFDSVNYGFRRIVFDGEWIYFTTVPVTDSKKQQ